MSKTAIGAALEAVGFNSAEYRLAAAIQSFFEQGGTIARGHALIDEVAARMPGEGRRRLASNSQKSSADAGQPIGGEEASSLVPKGHIGSASSPSNHRGGEGHAVGASKGHVPIALPVREPTPEYLKAAGEARKAIARSVLYQTKTSDGKWWGDIHPYEVSGMRRDHIRGMALMSALGPLNPEQMNMTFAQLLKPKQAEIAMDKADQEIRDAS